MIYFSSPTDCILTTGSDHLCVHFFLFFYFFAEEQATSFKTPGSQPYVIRSLALPGLAKENQNRAHSIVHRPFWWEVVSLVKLLPGNLTASVIELINQEEVKVSEGKYEFYLECWKKFHCFQH